MTGVLERRVLRTLLKQQDRTGGHRAPELSCSGRLPSVSGTIKIFKRPVQITCCRTAWLLGHATTVCHAEKCAYTHIHINTQTLHADRTVPRGALRPTDQWLVIHFTLTGVRHIKAFFCVCGAMSLKGHTSVCIPVACALTRHTHTHTVWPSLQTEKGNVRETETLWHLSKGREWFHNSVWILQRRSHY